MANKTFDEKYQKPGCFTKYHSSKKMFFVHEPIFRQTSCFRQKRCVFYIFDEKYLFFWRNKPFLAKYIFWRSTPFLTKYVFDEKHFLSKDNMLLQHSWRKTLTKETFDFLTFDLNNIVKLLTNYVYALQKWVKIDFWR